MTAQIDAVRLKTSDQPFFKIQTFRGDAVNVNFKLDFDTVDTSYTPQVRIDGVLKATPADYSIDVNIGMVTFTVAPALNSTVEVRYKGIIYTDAEIQIFLDESGNNTDYAAAKNLLAWAANAARLAKKEMASGGGGIGAVTLDLAVRAQELRASAKEYMDLYEATATDSIYGPAEGLTEPIWTEQMYDRVLEQDLVRDN